MDDNEIPIAVAVTSCCSSSKAKKEVQESGGFVNKGLIKWEQGREIWLTKDHANANSKGARSHNSNRVHRSAQNLNVDEVIDCIVSNRWRSALKGGKDKATFPQAVPLPQMIDILTDLW
uniref:Gag1-like clamp domain-containing protein n=1 Tax=Chaetoceros debilis TaxID=122233 RepID=A0A7S3Q2C9_9STRA